MRLLSWLMFWKKSAPRIAIVRLQGVISPTGSVSRKHLNLDQLEPVFKKAFAMNGIKAVALSINSPGGSPVQSELIGIRIRQLAEKHDVPILAFCEDVAASGGYWLAAAADEIYASNASVIGSIGVISSGFGFPEALTRLGIERRVYTSGKSKSMLDPFQPENPDDISHLQAIQNDIHKLFINFVKQRRGSRLKGADEELFNGRFWTGATAFELGLIDGIGSARDILQKRFGSKVKLITVAQKKSFLQSSFAGTMIEAIFDRLYQRSLWQRFGL